MDRRACRTRWGEMFKTAVEADNWGDLVSASEDYNRIANIMQDAIGELGLVSHEIVTVNQIVKSLQLRAKQCLDSKAKGLSLKELTKLTPVFDKLFKEPITSFPIDVPGSSYMAPTAMAAPTVVDEASPATAQFFHAGSDSVGAIVDFGSSVGPSGTSYVTVHVEKIGLKDADTYISPFVVISLCDGNGNVVEQHQTEKASSQDMTKNHVKFGFSAHFKCNPNALNTHYLFFEFKHWKAKKNKTSTRCWAFMEPKEIHENVNKTIALELYKKPTDFNRKRTNLHSVKNFAMFYVQVNVADM